MVRVPNFKLVANGKEITETIKFNLISLSFEDKEGSQSDEISFKVKGIYTKPNFGDSLKLWLGYGDELYFCGSFSLQTTIIDYKEKSTEVRATAVDFSSRQRTKKRRSWESTTIFGIARKIADENRLNTKLSGPDQNIASVLQDNINDIEFLYELCNQYGYLMAIKNETIVIALKDKREDKASNESLPKARVVLNELYSLEITDANRNSYDAVIAEWQDVGEGKIKSIKCGKGEQIYKMQIPQPKNDNEAYKKAEAKLNELQKGGINGSCSLAGANIPAGGKIKFLGIKELENIEFSVKSVSHSLSSSDYSINLEFEG